MLVSGLPRDAATWRKETDWSRQDELAAVLIEETGKWGSTLASLWAKNPKDLPASVSINHPSRAQEEEEERKREVETDPVRIAGFFAQHFK